MKSVFRHFFYFSFIFFFAFFHFHSIPVQAADTDNRCGENLTWTLENGTLTIQGTGPMYHYAEYGNKAPWRAQSANITNVKVLPGVTSVGNYAFINCTKITSADLADSVKDIGERVFRGCSALKTVKLPSNITIIPYDAFINCSALTQIQIPNSVTTIANHAFQNCDSLTSVTIPDSVTAISSCAFWGCDNLITANLGIGVNGFSYEIFVGCMKLKEINVDSDNPHISSLNGVVYSKNKDILIYHPAANGTTITIPNSVLGIRNNAFNEDITGLAGHVSMLKQIYFEGNAPTFGDDCFGDITATAYYPRSNTTWPSVIGSSYGGNITWAPYDFDSNLISLRDCQIDLEYETTPWTGNPKYPGVTVSYKGTTLEEGVHYKVDYANVKEVGTATVTITGLGSYTGTVTKTFTIRKGDQSLDLSIPNDTIEVGYSGTIKAIGSRGSLYITYASDHPEIATVDSKGKVTGVSPGTAVITVTSAGNENYLPLSKTMMIKVIPVVEGPYDINNCQITMTSGNQPYSGYAQKAYFTIKRGDTYLSQNRDYTVTCSNNIDVGTATAVVTGIGDYTGSATYTYEIVKTGQTVTASISPETIQIGQTAQITAEGIGEITYRSDDPDIATVDQTGKVTGITVGSVWVEVMAAGDRNHNAVSQSVRLKVEAEENPSLISISTCTVTLKTTKYTYDGSPKCPEATVMDGNTALVAGRDYSISYLNNVNAGYPTATVIGKGAYTGSTKPVTYEIEGAFQAVDIRTLSPLMIKVGESAQIEASGIGRLTYATSIANNSLEIDQDTGIVTGLARGSVEVYVHASGDNNHKPGTAYISVQVVASSGNNPSVPPTDPTQPSTSTTQPTQPTQPSTSTTQPTQPTQPFTSTTQPTQPTQPSTSTTQPTKPATQPTTITTKPATQPTTTAAKPVTQPAVKVSPVSKFSVSNVARRKMVVKWTKNTKVSGYQIQYCKRKTFSSGKKTVNVKKNSTVKKMISSLTKKKTYYVRIRAYKKDASGKKIYSSWSKIKSIKIKK